MSRRTTNTQLQQTVEDLQKEIDELRAQKRSWDEERKTLTNELTKKKRRKIAVKRGKNAINIEALLESGYPENAANYGLISNFVANKLFRNTKFLQSDWDVWDESEGNDTLSGQVSKIVSFPQAFLDAQDGKSNYWNEYLVPMINKKFSTLKGNATQTMRKLFMGKLIFFDMRHVQHNVLTQTITCH